MTTNPFMATKFLLLLSFIFMGCNNSNTTKQTSQKQTKTDIISKAKTLYYTDSGYSSITLKRDTVNGFPEIEEISRSQSYHFVSFLKYYSGGMGIWHALISELSIQHSRDAPGTYNGRILLKATVPNANPIQDTSNLYNINWADSITANEVHYRDEFIEAVLHRETEKSIKKLLSYSTGKTFIEFSSQLYGLQQPDSYQRRYIGYLEKPATSEHAIFDTIPDLYGVLSYIDPISNRSEFLILKAEQDASPSSIWKYEYFDGLSFEGVQTKAKDENFNMKSSEVQQWHYSNFNSFYIILRFKGAENIVLRIPVRNDHIDVGNLHSNSFKFQLISPETL